MLELIDGYCNSFKVKYMYLDELFKGKLDEKVKGKRLVDTVNIYINFESLYNRIRNSHIEKHIKDCTRKEIKSIYRNCISDFINVAAHYRKYFTNHKIKTNVIYYFNTIEDEFFDYNNSSLVDGYREHFFDSMNSIDRVTVNSLIREAIPFMRIIAEYLEDVYMLSSKRVESSLIPYLCMMENKFPSNLNVIITKDVYDFQYCNENALIISKSGNDPVILTKRNIMRYMRFKNKCKEEREINPILLTFILACTGDRKRSIPGISGFKFNRVYRALIELYDSGYIYDSNHETMNIANLCHVLNGKEYGVLKLSDVAVDILANYKACNFEYQYSVMSESQKDSIFDQIIDKSDPRALMDINDKYFEDYPLQLMELNNYDRNMKLEKYL